MTKEAIRKALEEMPDEFSLDEFMDRLILLQSFAEGREQQRQGRTFTHEEVSDRLAKWLR
ncbi:hypothetical protein [Tellurirhabdus rosea]|uniref:hypothetical protein n=1 Tax=Tellurirhabdus rosea TaxID=2674997 RepID=UPI002259F6EB|nr:hypothetical protein [Tellurirhabdus rosea]